MHLSNSVHSHKQARNEKPRGTRMSTRGIDCFSIIYNKYILNQTYVNSMYHGCRELKELLEIPSRQAA